METIRLAQLLAYSELSQYKSKIPEYAKDFKNEYLFIRLINKESGRFVKRLDLEGEVFKSQKAYKLQFLFRKFLKAQELGYLKPSSEFYIKESDVNLISTLGSQLDDLDYFYTEDTYNLECRKESQEFREFYDFFETFFSSINIKETTYSDFERELSYLDSDYDYSDSDY